MKIPEYISLEEKGYDLNVTTPIQRFDNYQCIVDVDSFDKWYRTHKGTSNIFFRGVKEAKYKNFTSAQRLYYKNDYLSVGPYDLVKAHIEEMRKVRNGILPAYCESMNMPCTDLFLLSCSQHHKNGISPLLDFTSNLNTALFFMCNDAQTPIGGSGVNHSMDINNFVSLYTTNPLNGYVSLQSLCNALIKAITQEAAQQLSDKEIDLSNLLKHKKAQRELADIFNGCVVKFFTYSSIRAVLYETYDYKPILIENRPLKIKLNDYEVNTKLIISNLNIVAQQGCFLYHDYGIAPLEKGITCVDIHKSLIPYIVNKYLKANNINKYSLFPTEDNIVNESTFNMMANIVVPHYEEC